VVALSKALEATWGTRPVFRRKGQHSGVYQMCKILGVESVLTGFSLPEDKRARPNEKLHLPHFLPGIEAFIRFLCILGE